MKNEVTSLANRRKKTNLIAATVFLAPAIVIMIIFIVYPIINSFQISFFDWSGITIGKKFNGLGNWKELIKDRNFWFAFRNNIIIMVLSLMIQLPLAIVLATFLDAKGKKVNFFKVCWFLPMLMSSVAIGFLFHYALDPNTGLLATISKKLGGGAVDLLGNPDRVLITVILVICWQFIPFYMIYFVAGYSGLSTDVYEAAVIDGATRNQYFWRIALPLLKPAIQSAAILSMVGSLKYFDLIFVMTGGGPGSSSELMATYMYKNAFEIQRMSYGSTIASAMFILITLFALLTMRLMNRKEED